MTGKSYRGSGTGGAVFRDKEKPEHVRESNIVAAKAVSDAIRTSLGPRGMDKMIQSGNGDVTITNDGATILKQMQVLHPAAKMLVELSKAQDIEAGDGTTSVCILAGSLLDACRKLLARGIHPTTISESFQRAAHESIKILESISVPILLTDREALVKSASTSLNSKVVSQYSSMLAPMAVDAVLRVMVGSPTDAPAGPGAAAVQIDLRNIRLVKKLGGVVDDTVMVEGLVLDQKTKNVGGPSRVEKAKIGLIQFCISPPKTDMENQVIISDYTQMDRVLKEERAYILNIVKAIKKSGCNVLLVQKSILRDAVSDLALHFLAKLKILVVSDIERDEVEFISKTLGCRPIASVDHMLAEQLASADMAEEVPLGGGEKVVRITGIGKLGVEGAPDDSAVGKTVTVLLRGSNKLVLDEADRSLHDALCVIRCLVKKRALLFGGGAPEMAISLKLLDLANKMSGMDSYCFRAFSDAMEVIPYTLSENAGLNPIETVTELRNRHANGEVHAGINVRKGCITNISEENVMQPLLVSTSAITLATETVRSILKIDDIVNASRD